jgi:hypothetical protein
MTALPAPEENENEQPILPLTPELIGKILSLNPTQLRKLRRMHRNDFCGCLVLVVEHGQVVSVSKVEQFTIGPTDE